MTHGSRALQSHDLSGEGINFGSHTYFFDQTRTWRPPQMRDQFNARATSETTRTLKTIHTIHSLIYCNKVDMIWMIMAAKWYSGHLEGLKLSHICLTGEEKSRKQPHPGNMSRPGIEFGPAAWQARMLPPAPQRWTNCHINCQNFMILRLYNICYILKTESTQNSNSIGLLVSEI